MLNRRHLRIKVLQNIFAWQMTDKKDLLSAKKELMHSIDNVYEMYVRMLALLSEITEYTSVDAIERANKHFPTAEDLKPNEILRLSSYSLQENPEFKSAVNNTKINGCRS